MAATHHTNTEFDFIICGGGTSGCVVAGRLAEVPNVKVLLIEAGERHEHLADVHRPGSFGNLLDKETDWNILSAKDVGINDRQIRLSRGKFLGGCSGCNGTVLIRGSKQDYDDWGLDGWSGDEFFGYMQKAETFHPKPWFKPATDTHGHDGPLHTEIQDLAPISKRILQSMVSQGFPLDDDMFSHGERPHGCGHAPRSTYQGTRSTSADFITKGYEKANITVLVHTLVDKVLIEKDANGDLRATGVQVVNSDGTKAKFTAKKEVIVSSGSLCSPNILNRSGIGEARELAALDINPIVELPGVGKNLMDHMVVFMFYETDKGLTHDHHVHHTNGLASSYQLWQKSKTGFLASYPSGSFAFARLDDRLADSTLWNSAPRAPGRDPMGLTPRQPNVEFWNTEAYGGPHFTDNPADNQYSFGMVAELFSPRSRGNVTLNSRNPAAKPVVQMGYLSDPLDVEVLSEACRLSNEIIMQGESTKDIVRGSWPAGLAHHEYTSRADWAKYVRDNATTCFHYAGTCAMGKAQDPLSVVDQNLIVKGVKNLRVADCSIMPTLNGGHTQMPAYGIGEKAADLIKATWGLFGNTVNARL